MRIATTAQMREIDRIAIEEHGIPSLELMETAASHVTNVVLQLLKDKKEPHVVVLCGTGNNGGDGLASARQLMAAGVNVTTYLVGKPEYQTPDSIENTKLLQKAGGELLPFDGFGLPSCDCIEDALFGVGLNREVGGDCFLAVEQINAANCPVVSCDIPSGINGDTGAVMGIAVKATETVTFSCAKPGLLVEPGKTYAGKLHIVDIGIPQEVLPQEVLPQER